MVSSSLPTGKLYKKENIRSLNNPPKNFKSDFSKNRRDNKGGAFDSNFQRKLISDLKMNEDVKNYLSASSELGQHMQEDIDMYITKDRLNEVEKKLDSIFKNIIRKT